MLSLVSRSQTTDIAENRGSVMNLANLLVVDSYFPVIGVIN